MTLTLCLSPALLRRGTAYKSKKDLSKAEADLLRVLNMEPQNKKAQVVILMIASVFYQR